MSISKHAYRRLFKAGNGHDVAIPVRISELAMLLDNVVAPEEKRMELIRTYEIRAAREVALNQRP